MAMSASATAAAAASTASSMAMGDMGGGMGGGNACQISVRQIEPAIPIYSLLTEPDAVELVHR